MKAINESDYDLAVKSNESDCSNVQSIESSSVEDFDSILSPGEIETMVNVQLFPYNHICSVA